MRNAWSSALLLGLLVRSTAAVAASLTWIEPPAGCGLTVGGISPDGAVVVGSLECWNPARQGLESTAYRWTSDTGVVALPHPQSGSFTSAFAASLDGGVIVGGGQVLDGRQRAAAMVWTPAGGTTVIDAPSSGPRPTAATGVSDDGSVIVGATETGGFVWRDDEGVLAIEAGTAVGVSGDGRVVVGYGSSPLGIQGFRWTDITGLQWLDDLEGGGVDSAAIDASWDGRIVVGGGSSAFYARHALRWVDGALQDLGNGWDPPNTEGGSSANSVSADGSRIVGFTGGHLLGVWPFVWDEEQGMRRLDSVLATEYGLDLAGAQLLANAHLSADGIWIAGNAIDASYTRRVGWIAEVAEPGSIGPALIGVSGLAALRSRRLRRESPVSG
jgi:uncharacterized membrane protein